MQSARNYEADNLGRVRRLREAMTRSEKYLWYDGLRDGRLGFRFRRQYPFGPYVLDFYCPELRFCVEVDGDTHEGREARDAARDVFLADAGIATLRVAADSVMLCLGEVLYRIKSACEELAGNLEVPEPPPCPPPPAHEPSRQGEASGKPPPADVCAGGGGQGGGASEASLSNQGGRAPKEPS